MIQEESAVIFQASLIGRADILQNAITSLKKSANLSDSEISALVSAERAEDGITPLHSAVHAGHTDVIRSIMNAGIALDVRPSLGQFEGLTAYETANDVVREVFHVYLFEQVAMGNVDSIRRLISGGVPANIVDSSDLRDSTLHWACSFGNTSVAALLLSSGCEVDALNAAGQSALHLACKGNSLPLVQMLLEEGADPTVRDSNDKLPIDLVAAVHADSPTIGALLREPPVSPAQPLRRQFLEGQEAAARRGHELRDAAAARRRSSSAASAVGGDSFLDGYYLLGDESGVHCEEHSDVSGQAQPGRSSPPALWPPVKHMALRKGGPLVLEAGARLAVSVVSADVGASALLSSSGFLGGMESLLRAAVQVQFGAQQVAQVCLVIDAAICPARHSYEIQVGAQRALLVAADCAGLLYATQTFLQLAQLHVDAEPAAGDGRRVCIPAMAVNDRPDVDNRAVVWSQRQFLSLSVAALADQVRLLSRLRMNLVHLVVDSEHALDAGPPLDGAVAGPLSSAQRSVSRVVEMCRQCHIEVVPTIIVKSVHQRLPQELLRLFSHSAINVVFALDSAATDLEVNSVRTYDGTVRDPGRECADVCRGLLESVAAAGFGTVLLSSSPWVRGVADLSSLAGAAGLVAKELDLGLALPPALFTKPLVCFRQYLEDMLAYSHHVASTGSSLAVFPALLERDFAYPTLFLKYLILVFSGLCWNRSRAADLVRNNPRGIEMRAAADALLLPPQSVHSQAVEALWAIVCGDLTTDEAASRAPNLSPEDCAETAAACCRSDHGENGKVAVPPAQLATAEKLIWSLLTLSDDYGAALCCDMVPCKSEAVMCLKLYRKCLSSANWRPNKLQTLAQRAGAGEGLFQNIFDFSSLVSGIGGSLSRPTNDLSAVGPEKDATDVLVGVGAREQQLRLEAELEEAFCVLNVACVLTRAVVLAYNSQRKLGAGPTKDGELSARRPLFDALPAGIRSDLANSVLESLGHCTAVWKQRYDPRLMDNFRKCNTLLSTTVAASAAASNSIEHSLAVETALARMAADRVLARGSSMAAHCLRQADRRYLLQDCPCIPASAMFRSLTGPLLPLPPAVEEFTARLFL